MTDLRQRLQALDDLAVPDVMARVRLIGPKAPEPELPPASRRVGAWVFAAVVAILALLVIAQVLRSPAPRPGEPTGPVEPPLRGTGEVLAYSSESNRFDGDLVAHDPDADRERIIVDADDLEGRALIGSAAWSADRRLVAFAVLGCARDFPTAGLWVSDSNGAAPRQLTTRTCLPGHAGPISELWAWSPTDEQLAVVSRIEDRDHIVVIDAVTGQEDDLGPAEVNLVTAIAWSPDGSRITYAGPPLPRTGSIYSLDIASGEVTTLIERIGYVAGFGKSGILWSPGREQLAILVSDDPGPFQLYLANADGSRLRSIAKGVEDAVWSPDGSRIAYATFSGPEADGRSELWTISPGDEEPLLVAASTGYPRYDLAWSPDGTMIAFAQATADDLSLFMALMADGSGHAVEIEEVLQRSWRGGWYFCECYG